VQVIKYLIINTFCWVLKAWYQPTYRQLFNHEKLTYLIYYVVDLLLNLLHFAASVMSSDWCKLLLFMHRPICMGCGRKIIPSTNVDKFSGAYLGCCISYIFINFIVILLCLSYRTAVWTCRSVGFLTDPTYCISTFEGTLQSLHDVADDAFNL